MADISSTVRKDQIPPVKMPAIWEIGEPGQPAKLIIHNGQLYIYDENGETLISGGKIQARAIEANTIIADMIVANAITTAKINDENVTNTKLSKWSRSKQVVVAPTSTEGDYTDIQSGINYLASIGGGVLFLAPGTYYQASNITISQSGVDIIGLDPDLCIIDFQNSNHLITANANDIQIENISIKRSTSTYGSIYINQKQFCGINNCKFSGNTYWDIKSYLIRNLTIKSCYSIQSSGFFNSVGYSEDITIIENTIKETTSITNGAIQINDAMNMKITNNTIRDGAGFGILCQDSGLYNQVQGNYIYSCDSDAIRVISGPYGDFVFNGNHLLQNGGNGIYIDTVYGAIISSNFIKDNGGDGIRLSDADETPINGNKIKGNTGYGIRVEAGVNRATIVGNNVDSNDLGQISDAGTNTISQHNNPTDGLS